MPERSSALKEIDLHRGDQPEAEWLAGRGFIPNPSVPYEVVQLNDWDRPGSESYVLTFGVQSGTSVVKAIAKACIKFHPTEVVREWHARRDRLIAFGVSVPKLYSVRGADYIEEYIEYDFRTAHRNASPEVKSELEQNFLNAFRDIHKAGFSPMSLHDLRSRGSDVVLVDYGFDLGAFKPDLQREIRPGRAEIALTNELK